jgi:hypothetical protein
MRGRSRPSNTAPRSTSVPLLKPNSQIDSAIWVANSFVSALRRPLTLTCIGRGGPFQENAWETVRDWGFLQAGPTLLQAEITRGHSKAATSQETNENRRITRIEELTWCQLWQRRKLRENCVLSHRVNQTLRQ